MLKKSSEGSCVITAKCSNLTKVLDDSNNRNDGSNVCQWTYGENENQRWIFEAIK